VAGGGRPGRAFLFRTIAREVASGLPALGSLAVKQGSVLYVDATRHMELAVEHLKETAGDAGADIHGMFVGMRASPDGLEPVFDWIRKEKRPRLVIFDTWQMKSNSRQDVLAALKRLEFMCDTYGTAVIIAGEPHDVYGYDARGVRPHAYLRLCWDLGAERGRLEVTYGTPIPWAHELCYLPETNEFHIFQPVSKTA
jgi:AAA domain